MQQLSGLRQELACLPGLKEVRPGAFYRAGRSVLHFHEDESGLYADVRFRLEEKYHRLPVTSLGDQRALLDQLRVALADKEPHARR